VLCYLGYRCRPPESANAPHLVVRRVLAPCVVLAPWLRRVSRDVSRPRAVVARRESSLHGGCAVSRAVVAHRESSSRGGCAVSRAVSRPRTVVVP